MDTDDLVPVCRLTDPSQVAIARSVLEGAGIVYFIKNERAQELLGWGRVGAGFNIVAGAPVVTVDAARADEARELLAGLVDPDAEPIEIGDEWQTEPEPTAPEPRTRWGALYWIVAVVAVVFFIGWAKNSLWVQGTVTGYTDVVLEVDERSAVRQELDLTAARLAHRLQELEITQPLIEFDDGIRVSGFAAERVSAVGELLAELLPDWSMSQEGPNVWHARMPDDFETSVIERAVEATRDGLRRELEARVRVGEGSSGPALVARLVGDWTLERAESRFREPVLFEMREVVIPPGRNPWGSSHAPEPSESILGRFGGQLPAHLELIPERDDPNLYRSVKQVPFVVGRDLESVSVQVDEWGQPVLAFYLTSDAGQRVEATTTRVIGRPIAIVLRSSNGAEIISAPVIESTIRRSGIIRGGLSREQVETLAAEARAGARPMFVKPVEILE